jgi:Polyketide cyclase / dehydrase and lipid transport
VADFERSTTVGVGADAAFAFLSDPSRVSEYVSPMTLDDSIAVDGDPEAPDEPDAGERLAEAHFLADAATRTVEWGMPGEPYQGSFTVTPGTTSTSQITIRLHVRDDADSAAVERVLGQSVRSLQRLLSGR